MPRILIAGCGYVGTAAADRFHQEGWSVEGWTRSAPSAELAAKPYPVIAMDLSRKEQVNTRSENFDVVIHCASTRGGDADAYRQVYLKGARNLLDRFLGTTLLVTSSTSVYAQNDGEWVTEKSPAQPEHEAGGVLRDFEELVLSRGGIVARLGGIHGPGRSAFLKKFREGTAVIDSQGDRFANQVHRDDIAEALLILSNPRTQPAQIYNVVDNAPTLRGDCYRWLAGRLNRPAPPSGRVPPNPKRGRSNKRVSNAKLQGMGWAPRYPSFAEAMEKSILPSFGL